MGILNTLQFLVIAVILTSAIGYRDSSDLVSSVPSHLRLLGYINTTIEDVERFDEEMCIKNGGPTAYDAHKEAWSTWEHCTNNIFIEVSMGLVSQNNEQLTRAQRLNMSCEAICRQRPRLEICFKDITEAMKTCLDPRKHENANIMYETIRSVMEFMCEDNAARLKVFMGYTTDRGNSCLRSKEQSLKGCANQTIFNYIQSTISDGATVGGLGAIHLLEPDFTKCSVFEEFKNCTLGVVDECVPLAFTNLLDSVLNVVKKATTCDHFLKSQASQTTAIELLLMSITVISFFSWFV